MGDITTHISTELGRGTPAWMAPGNVSLFHLFQDGY
jgi:hypothetical protein